MEKKKKKREQKEKDCEKRVEEKKERRKRTGKKEKKKKWIMGRGSKRKREDPSQNAGIWSVKQILEKILSK